jgi:hypothetical protein
MLPTRFREIITLMHEQAVHGVYFQAVERRREAIEDLPSVLGINRGIRYRWRLRDDAEAMRSRKIAADQDFGRAIGRRRIDVADASAARARMAAASCSPGRPPRLDTP